MLQFIKTVVVAALFSISLMFAIAVIQGFLPNLAPSLTPGDTIFLGIGLFFGIIIGYVFYHGD
jgi:hypothetical protein